MKLYELTKRDVLVKLEGDDPLISQEPFLFHHLDGMYSYCTDKKGNVFHLGCGTEVEVVDMYPRSNWGEQYISPPDRSPK